MGENKEWHGGVLRRGRRSSEREKEREGEEQRAREGKSQERRKDKEDLEAGRSERQRLQRWTNDGADDEL